MNSKHRSFAATWRTVAARSISTAAALVAAGSAVMATARCSDPSGAEGSGAVSTGDAGVTTSSPGCPPATRDGGMTPGEDPVLVYAKTQIEEGRKTFRYDTFGDEDFWGGALRLHEPIATLTPKAALAAGLKIDSDALPDAAASALKAGTLDLDSAQTTLIALKADAVVGVKGIFQGEKLASVGIQCALCHSTVDDALASGVGRRLDGWANRDLDIGAIVNLSPDLSAVAAALSVPETTVRTVLASWGKGKFDAALFLDGKAFRPDGTSAATLIPPAYGLLGVNGHTYTGWGSVTQWNAFVANLEMHGKGTYYDPRLDDATRFPLAAANKYGHTTASEDLVTPKLAALQLYQLSLDAPKPKAGTFDAAAAARGRSVFEGRGKCASCHVPPLFTEPGFNMHTAEEVGIDDFQASRSPELRYRTAPLRGLTAHAKGGFYHDGRFPSLEAVVDHYDQKKALALDPADKRDLVEFLKSL